MSPSEIGGNRVWALRRALGIPSRELARKARVSRDALHRIERGLLTAEPLVSTMRRLAEALELGHLSDIFVVEGDGGLLAELADTGAGLRAGVRSIREWLIAHDGAGTVTLGRLRGLVRVWLAACAPD